MPQFHFDYTELTEDAIVARHSFVNIDKHRVRSLNTAFFKMTYDQVLNIQCL